tara:strand:+ start:3639 stop:3869 length:231 start_codon:yes stop_codon:yes gene_type:complete
MLKRTQRYSGPRGSTEQLHHKHFVDETQQGYSYYNIQMATRRSNEQGQDIPSCKVFMMGLKKDRLVFNRFSGVVGI